MPRATAALTMEPVLGPRRTSSSSSRRRITAAAASKLVVVGGAAISSRGQFEREAADRLLGVLDHHLVDAGLDGGRVRLKVTGQPAWACSASAANSSTWAIEIGPSSIGQDADRGEARAQARLEAGERSMERSSSGQARWPRWRCGGSRGWDRAARGCGTLPSSAFLSSVGACGVMARVCTGAGPKVCTPA